MIKVRRAKIAKSKNKMITNQINQVLPSQSQKENKNLYPRENKKKGRRLLRRNNLSQRK